MEALALKNSETGSQSSLLANAKSDKRIWQSTDDEIKVTLKYCFVLLGIPESKYPEEHEKMVILDFIRTEFPSKSCSDIRLAFKWGTSGRFQIQKELFAEAFSCKYISRFINAYDEYVKAIPVKQEVIDTSKQLSDDTRTPEQKQDDILEMHIRERVNLLRYPQLIMANECFASLQRNNKIDLTEEKIKNVRQMVMEDYSTEIALSNRPDMSAMLKKEMNDDKKVRYMMKRKFVILYLQSLD